MDCMRDGFDAGKILDRRFLTVAPLNHGSFGMVFTARDTQTGADVAIKCITKPGAVVETNCPAAIATDDRSEELAIHSRLPYHPNIVNLIDHFETPAHQYMVLELCNNGDLYEAIRAGHGPLETEHVRDFMLQLVGAVDWLHTNGVYHRDIKPENIFLTSSGTLKLGDFGLATSETWSTEFAVGSDRYMAPEQFDAGVYGYGYSPASVDVWAIGIVLLNILFQRNPFTTPTANDPLFADFLRDRQSLFDVFPNMSQDTFNVLVHSLALDPANRSLGAVRDALKAAVSFTTTDECLDEFCTEQSETVPVTASAAREPLRTPSITSPNMSGGDSYPWSSTFLKTPPKPARQLSTIRDEPELFPGSVPSDWQYVDADEASLSSVVDSGLGMSYKSSKSTKSSASKAVNHLVGSLPISFTRPSRKPTSPYGGQGNGFSKSWSDLWDEEEEMEELELSPALLGLGIDRVNTAKPSTPQPSIIKDDDHGSITPRPRMLSSDLTDRAASPLRKLIEHDRAHPESPKQRSASILDKWSALGNFRRAKQEASISTSTSVTPTPTPTPSKPTTQPRDVFPPVTPSNHSAKKQKSQSKLRDGASSSVTASSWRQGSPVRLRSTSMHSMRHHWERKEGTTKDSSSPPPPLPPRHSQEHAWSLDNNWRAHKSRPTTSATQIKTTPPMAPSTPSRIPASLAQAQQKAFHLFSSPTAPSLAAPVTSTVSTTNFLDSAFTDDIGDLEWVGGWHHEDF